MSNVQDNTPPESPKPLSVSEAGDAILSRWEDTPEEELSEVEQEATPEDNQEETEIDSGDDSDDNLDEEIVEDDTDPDENDEVEVDENDDEEDEEAEVITDDEHLVEVLVDGEVKKASVRDLKRLYGQEASLTKKSQQTAKQRKEAEEAIQKTSVVMQRLIEKAQEAYKPYEDIDMLVASQEMTREDFASLRKESKLAKDNLDFLTQEAEQFYSEIQAQHQANLNEAATQAVKVLREDIPDWSNAMYDEIRQYSVSEGLPEQMVNTIVDPVVIKLLNKARLYDQTKKVATTKKAKTVTRTKSLKARKTPEQSADVAKQKRVKATKEKLRTAKRGNHLDDIADALMARWEQ